VVVLLVLVKVTTASYSIQTVGLQSYILFRISVISCLVVVESLHSSKEAYCMWDLRFLQWC